MKVEGTCDMEGTVYLKARSDGCKASSGDSCVD